MLQLPSTVNTQDYLVQSSIFSKFPLSSFDAIKSVKQPTIQVREVDEKASLSCNATEASDYPVAVATECYEDNIQNVRSSDSSIVKPRKKPRITQIHEDSEKYNSTTNEETSMEIDPVHDANKQDHENVKPQLRISAANKLFQDSYDKLFLEKELMDKLKNISDKLLHESVCTGPCNVIICRVIKELKQHVKKHQGSHKRRDDCKACAILYGAGLQHSARCILCFCKVDSCEDYKELINAEVYEFLRSSQCRVLYSKTPHFQADQKVTLNGDIFILSEITVGQGSFGRVCKTHLFLPKFNAEAAMALKRSIPRQGEILKTTRENYPLKKEALLFKKLPWHPNILFPQLILENIQSGGAMIFMKPYCCSLHDLLSYICREKNRMMTFGESVFYFTQVAKAVYHLHKHEIIHKDIKPKNVLLSHDHNQAVLADFDAAEFLSDGIFHPKERKKGTPGFLPPEVDRKEPHGKPADIFSLFSTLLELCCGVVPNETSASRMEKIAVIRKEDETFADFLMSGLQENPEKRPTAFDVLSSQVLEDFNHKSLPYVECHNHHPREVNSSIKPYALMIGSDSLQRKIKCYSGRSRESRCSAFHQLCKKTPEDTMLVDVTQ